MQKAVNYATLQTLPDSSLAALVIMFGLSLLIGWWVAGRALRPVSADHGRDQGDHRHRPVPADRRDRPADELRELADTIDGMLGRLDAAFAAERQLVADASHELRNPVAVIQANVDAVLADEHAAAETGGRPDGRHPGDQPDDPAGRGPARLRPPRSPPSPTRTSTSPSSPRSVVTEHTALAAGRALRLELRAAAGPVVYADLAALERALANVLANAIRLAPEGSTITVSIGSRQGWAWVSVTDQGPGIAVEDRLRVFDRFHRGATHPAPDSVWPSHARSSRATTGDCSSPISQDRAARS